MYDLRLYICERVQLTSLHIPKCDQHQYPSSSCLLDPRHAQLPLERHLRRYPPGAHTASWTASRDEVRCSPNCRRDTRTCTHSPWIPQGTPGSPCSYRPPRSIPSRSCSRVGTRHFPPVDTYDARRKNGAFQVRRNTKRTKNKSMKKNSTSKNEKKLTKLKI